MCSTWIRSCGSFIEKLGLSGYAFALDDDVGNVNATGANSVDIAVGTEGASTGLPQQRPLHGHGAVRRGDVEAARPDDALQQPDQADEPAVVYQTSQYDYNNNILGTMVNGTGVKWGRRFSSLRFRPIIRRAGHWS